MRRKFNLIIIGFLILSNSAWGWNPSSPLRQIPLGIHDDVVVSKEKETHVTRKTVAGKPWTSLSNITHPTITHYPAKGKNSDITIMVIPGGGYRSLAIDLEGSEVCDWLTTKGISCFLLKYRVPDASGVKPKDDAKQAMKLIREKAKEWGINPQKLGVIGFSVGGQMAADLSLSSGETRPEFAVIVYPRTLPTPATNSTSPTFLIHATDDKSEDANASLAYYKSLKDAGASVEMHLYSEGGHAFGIRPTGLPIQNWPELMLAWLKTRFP